MSEKLSEQMKAQTKRMGGHTFTEGTWWVSVADIEAKLEAMSQVIEVVRAVLPNMIAKGPLSEASRLDFALQEFDAAQQEGR